MKYMVGVLLLALLMLIGCNPLSPDDKGRVNLSVTVTGSYGTSAGKYGARGYVTNDSGSKVYNVVLEATQVSWSKEIAASLNKGERVNFDTGYLKEYSSLKCTAQSE